MQSLCTKIKRPTMVVIALESQTTYLVEGGKDLPVEIMDLRVVHLRKI